MDIQNISFGQGTTPILRFIIAPLEDVGSWSTLFTLTANPRDTVVVLSKVGVPSATFGVTNVTLSPAETRALARRPYTFTFARTDSGYEQVLATGTVTVTQGII